MTLAIDSIKFKEIPVGGRYNKNSEISTDQAFNIFNINNGRLGLRLRYNTYMDTWFFDLKVDNKYILFGRRLILNMDLLAMFGLNIGKLYAFDVEGIRQNKIVNESISKFTLPDKKVRLYYVSEDGFDEAIDLIK